MHNPESVQENEMQKVLWYFEMQPDHPIPEKYEKINKYMDLARDLKKKKLWNMKLTVIPIVSRALGTIPKG